MSELYDLSLDELLKGDATLLNKIERDMKVAKAENNVIKFAWISIVRNALPARPYNELGRPGHPENRRNIRLDRPCTP